MKALSLTLRIPRRGGLIASARPPTERELNKRLKRSRADKLRALELHLGGLLMFCGILICGFDQEASAIIYAALIGLSGGLIALGGAILVGFRQTAIQRDQVKLAKRAFELEELRLKSELYERRAKVFADVNEATHILGWLYARKAEPLPVEDLEQRQTAQRQFRDAQSAASFLFGKAVQDELDRVAKLTQKIHTEDRMATQLSGIERANALARRSKLRREILDASKNFRALFLPEMAVASGSE